MNESPTPNSETWPWWWSRDEERYAGPFATRHDAIIDAFADGELGSVHVQQAWQAALAVQLFTGAELAERFDEINEDNADPDGDPLSAEIPTERWEALANFLTARMRDTVRSVGVASWAFRSQTNGEWVNLTRARRTALRQEVLDLLDEIAIGLDPEVSWADSYIDEKVAELKLAVRLPRSGSDAQ